VTNVSLAKQADAADDEDELSAARGDPTSIIS